MAGGARLGFDPYTQGGPYGYSFAVRYDRESKFQVAYVYLPYGWDPGDVPSLETLPRLRVKHYRTGGTWYNQGLDALDISSGFALDVALSVSNKYYGVVITSDYRPAGYGISKSEDVERAYWPDVLDDMAQVIQYFRNVADDLSFGWDRPLSRDPDDTLCYGPSSGGHQVLFTALAPDGTFEYSEQLHSDDEFAPRYSHCCNPVIVSVGQTTMTGFNKGTTDYTWNQSYGDYSWAGALFGNPNDLVDWDDVPMATKRQSDVHEWAVISNPRVRDMGVYFTAPHVSTVPRGSLLNDPTGASPASFKNRYWRYTGGEPAPIGVALPLVDDVQAIANGGTDKSIFRRQSGSWTTDGYAPGTIVVTHGMGANTNHHYVVDSVTNGGLDLVVLDPDDLVEDVASASGNFVASGCLCDLHDEGMMYIGYDAMVSAGSTKSRLRAGTVDTTNPDPTTTYDNADQADFESWIEAEFGWVALDA